MQLSANIPPRFSGLTITMKTVEEMDPSPFELVTHQETMDYIRQDVKQLTDVDFEVEARPEGITGKFQFKSEASETPRQNVFIVNSKPKEALVSFIRRLISLARSVKTTRDLEDGKEV